MYFLIITLYGTVTLSANLLFHKIRHHSLHLCVCYLQKLVYILKLLTVRPDSPEYHQEKKVDPKERHVIKSGRQLFSVTQYGRKLNVSVFVSPFYRILPSFEPLLPTVLCCNFHEKNNIVQDIQQIFNKTNFQEKIGRTANPVNHNLTYFPISTAPFDQLVYDQKLTIKLTVSILPLQTLSTN